jgi:hypothetical protein
MARLPRRLQWAQAACYHLMDRGHNRDTVFYDDQDRQRFLDLVARSQKRFNGAMVTVYVSSSSLLSYGENVPLSSLTLADPWIIRPKKIAHDRR